VLFNCFSFTKHKQSGKSTFVIFHNAKLSQEFATIKRPTKYSLSFLLNDLDADGEIYVKPFGVKVLKGSGAAAVSTGEKTITERVLERPEQTFDRVLAAIPRRVIDASSSRARAEIGVARAGYDTPIEEQCKPGPGPTKAMAAGDGNRTRQKRVAALLVGFEDRAGHQPRKPRHVPT